ncbi:MAG: OmpA family protein [Bacteroidota bacterium]
MINKIAKLFITGFLSSCLFFSVNAQVAKTPKKFQLDYVVSPEEAALYSDAEYYFQEKEYATALPMFINLDRNFPGEVLYTFRVGICYLNRSGEETKSLEFFERVYARKPNMKGLFFYMGKSYQYSFLWDKALEFFEKYITENPKDKNVDEAKQAIINCKNAKEVFKNTVNVDVKSLGKNVNTIYAEYSQVITPDGKTIFYSHRGDSTVIGNYDEKMVPLPLFDFYEEVYQSNFENGEWALPKKVGAPFNSGENHAALSPSADESAIFVYKNVLDESKSDIYQTAYKNGKWDELKLVDKINSKAFEGSATMTKDGNTIFFSSDRAGGIGKRDLYRIDKDASGKWSEPVNLGPEINTELNEEAPYVSPDGNILYFSSEGHSSIGGYDVFKSSITGKQIAKPINLGFPINSINSDIYLVLTADGKHAYYSSARPGALGMYDLFTFDTENMDKKASLLTVNGTVTTEQKPLEARVRVYNGNNDLLGTYGSNTFDGKYAFTLLTGYKYKFVYEANSFVPQEEMLDATAFTESVERTINVDLKHKDDAAKEDSIKQAIAAREALIAENIAKAKQTTEVATTSTTTVTTKAVTTATTTTTAEIPSEINVPRQIYFDYDKNAITANSKASLDLLLKALKQFKSIQIEVIAHTDSKGEEAYNQRLSLRRANAVSTYLAGKGVAASRIKATGKGESTPLVPNENADGSDNPDSRAKNRRAEIKLSSDKYPNLKINYTE